MQVDRLTEMSYSGFNESLQAMFGSIFDWNSPISVDVEPGWRHLIFDACHALSQCLPDSELDDFRFRQVKEKFGMLTIYTDATSRFARDVIDYAQEMSFVTCIDCGRTGKHRKSGWMRVTCDDCETARATHRR